MPDEEGELLKRMTRDLRKAAASMSPADARYMVDTYYQMQEFRKRTNNQVRAQSETGEPHAVLFYVSDNFDLLEQQIKGALLTYAKGHPLGSWMLSVYGIGPVISAGLLAYVDWDTTNHASRVWRYAGLDPSVTWEKGQKRPWNAGLKTLCWKAGDCFVKFSNRDECRYGKLYRQRKEYEIKRNDAYELADQAAAKVDKVGKTTEAYQWYAVGKLPPAHIDNRARRWAVKMFLSHCVEKARELRGEEPAAPWIIEHGGHQDWDAA